ncbi:hypothetical protein BC628DRAFT_1041831 [Trametes gibbosa]|nr:hypothetical protein BC628DRAFT_1041831 [Trametes gibbosa]
MEGFRGCVVGVVGVVEGSEQDVYSCRRAGWRKGRKARVSKLGHPLSRPPRRLPAPAAPPCPRAYFRPSSHVQNRKSTIPTYLLAKYHTAMINTGVINGARKPHLRPVKQVGHGQCTSTWYIIAIHSRLKERTARSWVCAAQVGFTQPYTKGFVCQDTYVVGEGE